MRHYLLLLVLLLLFACSEPQHPLLYDDDKAVSLLIDLNIANIAVNKYPLDYRDSMGGVYKSQIATLHKLSEHELDTIVWMMQNDYDRYNRLYKKLVDTLQDLESMLGRITEDKPNLQNRNNLDSSKANK